MTRTFRDYARSFAENLDARKAYRWASGVCAAAALAITLPYIWKTTERIPEDCMGIIYHDITTDSFSRDHGQKSYKLDDGKIILVDLKNKDDGDYDHFDPDGFYSMRDITTGDETVSERTIQRMAETARENIRYRQKAQRLTEDIRKNGKPVKTMTSYLGNHIPLLSKLPKIPFFDPWEVEIEEPINWINIYSREKSWDPPVSITLNEVGDLIFCVTGDEPYTFTDSSGNGSMDETLLEANSGVPTERYRREFLDKIVD